MPTWLTLPGVSPPEGPAPPHLVLVGLPGAGKSTVARALGRRAGRPVLEFDREIERRAGASVAALFERDGEAAFRRRERELTDEVAAWPGGLIVDPGGGWVADPGAMERLRPPAQVVWLQVDPAEAARRLGPSARTRPLLRGADPEVTIAALLARRQGRYALADIAIDTHGAPADAIADRIMAVMAPPAADGS